MNKRNREDATEVVRRAVEWFGSDAGRQSRDDAKVRATDTRELLERGHKIDPKKLSEPFTV
jgi:hypothetical protein